MQLDVALLRALNNLTGRYDGLDSLAVFAAVFLLPLMVFLLFVAAFTVKRLREEHWYEMPLKALVAGAIAYGVRFAVGVLVGRPRPFLALSDVHLLVSGESSYSFPSGHAAVAFALAFALYRHDRDWGIAFLILASVVALGRVAVGVHYPLDVVGGAAVGWFGAWVVGRLEGREGSKIERALRGGMRKL